MRCQTCDVRSSSSRCQICSGLSLYINGKQEPGTLRAVFSDLAARVAGFFAANWLRLGYTDANYFPTRLPPLQTLPPPPLLQVLRP